MCTYLNCDIEQFQLLLVHWHWTIAISEIGGLEDRIRQGKVRRQRR